MCRKQHVRNEALVAYVKQLHPRYRIGLLSNVGRGFIDDLFTQSELDELFETVVLSNEVGLAKPSPDIFRLTAERLGLSTDECVMIDDSINNIDGAKAVGMQGIVYQSLRQMTAELDVLLKETHA